MLQGLAAFAGGVALVGAMVLPGVVMYWRGIGRD
jgi:hypothetical protein